MFAPPRLWMGCTLHPRLPRFHRHWAYGFSTGKNTPYNLSTNVDAKGKLILTLARIRCEGYRAPLSTFGRTGGLVRPPLAFPNKAS